MARTKAVLGSGARLADYLSASLLARVVPAQAVHAVLDAHGCNSQRVRSFPAVAGVYYCMALSLYPEAAYGDVFDAVAPRSGVAMPKRSTCQHQGFIHQRSACTPVLADIQGPAGARLPAHGAGRVVP